MQHAISSETLHLSRCRTSSRTPGQQTCAMLKMCRSSAKLGCTYWRRDRAKNSSYSRKASTSLAREQRAGETAVRMAGNALQPPRHAAGPAHAMWPAPDNHSIRRQSSTCHIISADQPQHPNCCPCPSNSLEGHEKAADCRHHAAQAAGARVLAVLRNPPVHLLHDLQNCTQVREEGKSPR